MDTAHTDAPKDDARQMDARQLEANQYTSQKALLGVPLIDPETSLDLRAQEGADFSIGAVAELLETLAENGSLGQSLLPLLVEHPEFRQPYEEYLELERRFCHPHRAVLRWELHGLEADLRSLLAIPPTEWEWYMEQAEAESLYSWSLCLRLLEVVLDQVREDTARARRLAQLVMRLAEGLPNAEFALAERRQLVALARAHVGNAFRVEGELREAAAWLEEAEAEISQWGATELGLAAEVKVLHSYLCRDARDFERACRLAEEARQWAKSARRAKVEVWATLNLASIHFFSGHAEEALEALDACLPALEAGPGAAGSRELDGVASQQRRWYAQALANRAMLLAQCGAPEKAQQALREARSAVRLYGGPTDQIRCLWIKAGVLDQLGAWSDSRRCYESVIDGFLELDRAYDAALVTLEFAAQLLERGETRRVRQLALRIVPVFQRQGVERETLGALELLRTAAVAQQLSLAQVEGWLDKLRRAR